MATGMGYAQLLRAVAPLSTQEERHIISELEIDVNTSALGEDEAVERLTAMLMERLHRQGSSAQSMPPPAMDNPPAAHTEASVVDALSMLAVSMSRMQKTVQVEHFSGSKDESPEEWMNRFETAAGLNSWLSDTEKQDRFKMALKRPASLWYHRHQEELRRGTWGETKSAFIERYRPSLTQTAYALKTCRQEKDESVQQFAERYEKLVAKFPGQPEEIKVSEFVSKLLPKLEAVMVNHFVNTTKEAIEYAKRLESRQEGNALREADLEARVREALKARGVQSQSNPARNATKPFPGAGRTGPNAYDARNNSQDWRHDQNGMAQQRPAAPPPLLQNLQAGPNTNAGGARNVNPPRGPECFKCGQLGHIARECPGSSGAQQAMVADGAPGSEAPIAMQRPPNRVGFDVTRQSVQRPQSAQRAAPRSNPLEGDALLAQASINVPLGSFSQMAGMSNRLANFVKDAQSVARLAQSAPELPPVEPPLEAGYATMRLLPGSASIQGCPSGDTVLDSGASFSMASMEYVRSCGLEDKLEPHAWSFVTADGSTADSAHMLRGANVQVGLCHYSVDLVVALSPKFDMLLGVDFMDATNATIRMDKRVVLLTGSLEGEKLTQPVMLTVGRGAARPMRDDGGEALRVHCVDERVRSSPAAALQTPAQHARLRSHRQSTIHTAVPRRAPRALRRRPCSHLRRGCLERRHMWGRMQALRRGCPGRVNLLMISSRAKTSSFKPSLTGRRCERRGPCRRVPCTLTQGGLTSTFSQRDLRPMRRGWVKQTQQARKIGPRKNGQNGPRKNGQHKLQQVRHL